MTAPACGNCGDCVQCLAAHPAGKTCSDCTRFARCQSFIGITGQETYCDWLPSAFRLRPSTEFIHRLMAVSTSTPEAKP